MRPLIRLLPKESLLQEMHQGIINILHFGYNEFQLSRARYDLPFFPAELN